MAETGEGSGSGIPGVGDLDSASGGATQLSLVSENLQLVVSWCSPMAHQVALALRLKGVKYKEIDESGLNKNLRTLELNPLFKKIPLLVHNRKLLSEPLLLVEYIDEVWFSESSRLLPVDAYGRFSARYWSNFVHTKVVLTALRIADGEGHFLVPSLLDTFVSLEKILSQTSPNNLFFMGDQLGFVDVMFAPILPWIEALQRLNMVELPSPQDCPRLHRWMRDLGQHDLVKPILQICNQTKLEDCIRTYIRSRGESNLIHTAH